MPQLPASRRSILILFSNRRLGLAVHQVTLFNKYSDAFRRSSARYLVSPVLVAEFLNTPSGYERLSNHILQNRSFHTDAQFLKLNYVRLDD